MKLYADTGFLVSLQTSDANSRPARARMKRHGAPLVWTWLHETEFRNAIRLQAFRKQIDPSDVMAILHKQALGLSHLLAERGFIQRGHRTKIEHAGRDALLFQQSSGFQRAMHAYAKGCNR